MTLSELFLKAGLQPIESVGDAEITSITMDSRTVQPGSLFVCMPGMTREPESFIPEAAAAGAAAALLHSGAGLESARSYGLAAAVFSPTGNAFADAVWRVCDAFFDHPTRDMNLIGVTGTNGKTTTAWLIRDMIAALGEPAGYLGTLGIQIPGEDRTLNNTTPYGVELYNLLAEAREKGTRGLAIEISSHALAEHRADGLEFDAAVFTNLTQDHLDYHGTMEAYGAAKWRLFRELPRLSEKKFTAAFNLDDPTGETWVSRIGETTPVIRYSLSNKEADLYATHLKVTLDSVSCHLHFGGEEIAVKSALGGSYNASNLLSAVAGMLALGYPLAQLKDAVAKVRPVPGRFEAVPNNRGISVLVDYAHTPDALEKLLDAVRPLTKGKIITVFGCGGDRDRTKRPKMAKAASERSDYCVVTSDNPRTEDPKAIISEIMPGILHGRDSKAIVDRVEAIHYAIRHAKPGDVVVVAGKGHENYQIIGRTKHPMDDRLIAKDAMEGR